MTHMNDRRTNLALARTARRGFTLVELCMGLVVTMLVAGALSAFAYATGEGWAHSESSQSLFVAGNQVTARIQKIISLSRQVGLVRLGSADGSATGAAIMLWKADTNNDSKISFSEVALIQHNTSTGELWYYEANPPTAADDWLASTNFITNSSAPETFKALTYVSGKKLAKNVRGAQFVVMNSGSHSQRPIFEFTLNFTRGTFASTLYGTATVRSVSQATN